METSDQQQDKKAKYDLSAQLKKLLAILIRKEKIELAGLVAVSIFTSLIQSFSVISLMPFMNLVMNPSVIDTNQIYAALFKFGRFQSEKSFVFILGFIVIALIVLANLAAAATTYYTNRFVQYRYHSLSSRLLMIYLNKPYEFFLQNNSNSLGQTLLTEVNNFINQYLKSFLNLITNVVMFIVLFATLMIVDLKITISVVLLFGSVYGLLNFFTKSRLTRSGALLMKFSGERFKASMEAFNSIKITKSLEIEPFFINRYDKASKKFAQHALRLSIISDLPSHMVEIFAFTGIVSVVLVILQKGNNINSYMPLLSVFTLAGYRLLPVITLIYRTFATTEHSKVILDKLYQDMVLNNQKSVSISNAQKLESLPFKKQVTFNHCSFSYTDSHTIIDQLNLIIPKGSIVGFAGTTGAGKTTLIDLFLGLLSPTEGEILVDDIQINESSLKAWRSMIGYVPQDIFLIDDTIRRNIAFGIPEAQINDQKVREVCQIASISDYIESTLPEKYETVVGERGVRLSGGQRQRLGLARALYREPEVLILDEATSALDGATEEQVLGGIHGESAVRTMLIIAHRLNTLKVCDQIYLLEKGRIIGQGTYDELIKTNEQFMKMAKVE